MKGANQFKAGILVIISVTVFVASIWVMGSYREIFSRQQEYFTSFADVKGLAEGAPVRLGGITIGRVSRISFDSKPESPEIQVSLLINQRYLDRIRADAKVAIETQGLLGDRFINITIGKETASLPPGSVIQSDSGKDLSELLSKAGTIVENTVQVSENIKTFSDTLKEKSITDLTEGLKSLSDVSKNLKEITSKIKSGDNLAHSVFYDPSGKDTVSAFTEAAKNLASATADVGDIMKTIKSGDGTMHDLIYKDTDEQEGLSDVVAKLNKTAENLRVATEALKDGTGTIGALLVDSKLYDNLVEVTDGAKRSFLLREAVRSSLNNK